jgi:cell division protein FtsB
MSSLDEFAKLENLEQFRFNLGNAGHTLFDTLSKKETINNQSLSDFVAQESIQQLSARIMETNEQVKKLQEVCVIMLIIVYELITQSADTAAKAID